MTLVIDFSWRRLAVMIAAVSAALLCAATFVGSAHAASSIFGTTGSSPVAIAVDSAGNVYTANKGSNNVSKITPGGTSTILGTTGTGPAGIAIDSAGNVYTANSGSNNVSKITPGGTSTILGTTGTGPAGIAIDSAGNLYTANSGSNNVSKLTSAGTSTILGTTEGPKAIAVDSAGNVYTANATTSVTKFTPGGTSSVYSTCALSGGDCPNPQGIAVDSAGNIYVTGMGLSGPGNSPTNYIMMKITMGSPYPTTTDVYVGNTPVGVTIDSAGNVYTANSGSNNVSKITPAGASSIIGTTGSSPVGIAVDSAGNAYTANSGSNNVSKITAGAPVPPPARPSVQWSSSSKHKTATGLVVPVSGVSYSITAVRKGVKKSGSCKAKKIKHGKKKVSRVECVIKLSKGTSSVSVTPKQGSLVGSPSVKSIKIK